jgi:twinkle protein
MSRHGIRGYYALADLPQRASIEGRGISTTWWELDQIFKLYYGQFTVVSGLPGSGKSTLLLNMISRLAKREGIGSFLYVPENEGQLQHILKKIWGNDAGFEHFIQSQCFVQTSVTDEYDDEPHTLPWVLERARDAVERDKVEIIVVDPWNELDRAKPKDMLLTDYIAECLRLIKQFCRKFDVSFFMVVHPTKAVNESGGRIPKLSDCEGSMAWWNKCDNGLIVHREPEKNSTIVMSTKVREIGAGKLGVCHFDVDPQTGIFMPQYGGAT